MRNMGNMEKMDPIKTAEKIRADLDSELDKELEEAMEDNNKEDDKTVEKSGKQSVESNAQEAKKGRKEPGEKRKRIINRESTKKNDEQRKEFIKEKLEETSKLLETQEGLSEDEKNKALEKSKKDAETLYDNAFKNKKNKKITEEKLDEAGDLELADKIGKDREIFQEELDEAGDLELADKIEPEKENEKEVISEAGKEADSETKEGEKKESSGEKLEALRQKLEKAREEYIKKDFEIDKKASMIYRVLRIEKLEKLGLGNARDEVEIYKSNYEKALKDYKDAVIDSEHVEDKEDVEMVAHWLVAREYLNLRNAQTDVRMEGNYDWERFKKGFLRMVNNYRKLCALPGKVVSQQISKWTGSKWVGAGASLATGAGVMGTVFSHAGGATIPLRVFSGLVSTVGFKQMLEANAEKKRVKKEEEEVEDIKEAVKSKYEKEFSLSEEDKKEEEKDKKSESIDFEELKVLLDDKISRMDSQVQSDKQWKQWRTLMAAGAGTGVVFGGYWLGQHMAEYFQGHSGGEIPETAVKSDVNNEAIKGQVEQALHKPEFDTLGGSDINSEAIKGQVEQVLHRPEFNTLGTNVEEMGAMEAGAAEAMSGIEIAESGDSVWKLAENQLESRGYFKGLTGTPEEILAKRTYLIDAIKDKIAENPKDFGLVDADKIQVGQKIDFSRIFENESDIKNIINNAESLNRDDMASIIKNLTGEAPLSETEAEMATEDLKEKISPVETSEKVDMRSLQMKEMEIAHALGLRPEEYSAINDSKVGEFLNETNSGKKLSDLSDLSYSHSYEPYRELYWGEGFSKLSEFLNEQASKVPGSADLSIGEFLREINPENLPADSIKNEIFSSEDYTKYLTVVLQQETAETIRICAGNNASAWNEIKNVLVGDSGQNKIVENIRTAVAKVLPKGVAVPSSNDTVEKWMINVTKEAYKRGLADNLREQLLISRK